LSSQDSNKGCTRQKVRGGGDGIVDGNQVNHLSMAFGFVECDPSEESVRKAIKALQGTIVDEHALELNRSSKGVASSVPKKSQGSNPTKLMVRNVPFQATRKELLQLFHRACIAFRMMRWPLCLLATCALFFQIVWLLFWYPQSDNFLYSSLTRNNEWNCDSDAAPLCNMTTTPLETPLQADFFTFLRIPKTGSTSLLKYLQGYSGMASLDQLLRSENQNILPPRLLLPCYFGNVSSFHHNACKGSGYDCYHAGYAGMVKHWYRAMDVWIDQEFDRDSNVTSFNVSTMGTFTIVRDPFDRLRSYFEYCSQWVEEQLWKEMHSTKAQCMKR
jgi:hypothetical protein